MSKHDDICCSLKSQEVSVIDFNLFDLSHLFSRNCYIILSE